MSKKPTFSKIPVGISSCLLGEAVRYDGDHSYSSDINNHLDVFFDFQPVCPEIGIGMGVPRDPIRLVKIDDQVRVLGIDDPTIDVTDLLRNYGINTAKRLSHIAGYIFKSRSPSCGMQSVKTFNKMGGPEKSDGVGAFANEIMKTIPNLPVEEDGRLHDPRLRDNFIERVFTYHHWQQLNQDGITPAKLLEFHLQYKSAIMSHNQAACKRLEKLIHNIDNAEINHVRDNYETELMAAMKHPSKNKLDINGLGFSQPI